MSRWVAACGTRELTPEHGVAVVVKDRRVALFMTQDGSRCSVHAVGVPDEFSSADTPVRSVLRSADARRTTSAVHGHAFDVTTGERLTDFSAQLAAHRTFVAGGTVYVEVQPTPVRDPDQGDHVGPTAVRR